MEVIPVLDLKDGAVVHARMGRRSEYHPIQTPLSSTSNPIDVARGLLSIYPFETFYIADLNAIERNGDNDVALLHLKAEFPDVTFWVDNGAADLANARCWLDAGLGDLVLGSESQKDDVAAHGLSRNDRVVLSLDYRGDAFVGPIALLSNVDAWPRRVIVMTLARVGGNAGPDMDRLAAISARATESVVYAAGGLRGPSDLRRLTQAGVRGVLVASALHDGHLTGTDLIAAQRQSAECAK